jgi:hypothetical protein
MRWLLRGVLIVAATLIVFAGALYVLSESREVVILHARDPDGAERATHLWIVDDAGAGWLRSSGHARGWFVAVTSNPQIELERAGETRPYTAVVVDTPEAGARVSALMREKYGWIDALIETVEGGWEPVAVRLDPR